MGVASRRAQWASRLMDGARPRATPSGIAPGMTERAADQAVTVLYESHYVALVREATLLVGDFATAEDVVQDCFIALHRAWWRVRDTSTALPVSRSRHHERCMAMKQSCTTSSAVARSPTSSVANRTKAR